MVFFCSFAHLTIPRSPPKFNQFFLVYYSGPVHKISSQSVHNFLSNVVHRQTDKLTNATKNITSFAKEVTKNMRSVRNCSEQIGPNTHMTHMICSISERLYSKTCLKRLVNGPKKMWVCFFRTSGLLLQVNYS